MIASLRLAYPLDCARIKIMEDPDHDLIKHREIAFCSLHADPHQAETAMLFFSGLDGIVHLDLSGTHKLNVSYDIRLITLQLLEETLIELGFHLDNSLLSKLKRALYYYTEEVQRENCGYTQSQQHTRDVFINRYNRLQHGCRDNRPDYWRKYL